VRPATELEPPKVDAVEPPSASLRERGARIPVLGWVVKDPRQLLWLLFLVPPLVLPDFDLFRASSVLIFVPVVVGFNLMTGYGGQFVVFSASMVGVGAYATIIALNHGVPLPAAMLTGGAVTAAVGYVLGIVTTRITGIYLALGSVGVATAINVVMNEWRPVTGGGDGLAFPHDALGDLWPLPPLYVYGLILAVTLVGMIVAWRVVSAQFGRELRALRVNPIAAAACGVNVNSCKAAIVSVGCFYWGIAGSLQALNGGYIAPSDFGLDVATLHLAMVVIGGLGAFEGPVLGALVVGGLKNVLVFSLGFQTLIFAALLYLVILTMPGGLAEGIRRLARLGIVVGTRVARR